MTESCIHSFMGPVPGGVDMTWEIDGLKQQQSSVVTGRLSQFPGTSGKTKNPSGSGFSALLTQFAD